jgi:hypothetical protein
MFCNSPHPDTPPLPLPPGKTAEQLTEAEKCELLRTERANYGHAGVVRCMRFADHEGDHAGYGFSIRTPITWPAAAAELDATA